MELNTLKKWLPLYGGTWGFLKRKVQTEVRCPLRLMLCCCSWVTKSLCDPINCSPPGFSVHRISQARILDCVAISSPRVSSKPKDQMPVFWIGRQILYHWATREAPGLMLPKIISDDAQWYWAVSMKTEVSNKSSPFSSLQSPVREHGAHLSPTSHKLKPVSSWLPLCNIFMGIVFPYLLWTF